MRQLFSFSLSLLILIFCECGSSSSVTNTNLLLGKTWVLSNLSGLGLDPVKFNEAAPSLSFLEGGRLAGFAGCNNFSGGFSIEGTSLQLDPGAMTKKACPGTGEDEFITALAKVNQFKIIDQKLVLLEGAAELMSFTPKKD